VPDKPRNLDPLAERILDGLAGKPDAAEIVLGGYFALQHYTDYRTTHDIDAWWRDRASGDAESTIRSVMEHVAADEGFELESRRFGETVSFELRRSGNKRFSFQIAIRSVELDPPLPSAWPPILIESFHDNIGAKMNAAVSRGAPRDFLDIRHVVTTGLVTAAQCWELWQRKNPGDSGGREKVRFHLAGLELRRPLESIADPQERMKAQETRQWFRDTFLAS